MDMQAQASSPSSPGSQGAAAVFQAVPGITAAALASQLPRKARWVMLLVDGKRSVADLAHLTQRSERDVASTLARLLQWGFIELVYCSSPSTPSSSSIPAVPMERDRGMV